MDEMLAIIICIMLGITLIINIALIVYKILRPEKKEDIKGVAIKGHYTTHCIGPCVCNIWHSDE